MADSPKFDVSAVEAKFKKIADAVNAVQGKVNYNPFVWLEKHNVTALNTRYAKGERTPELEKAILALPTEIQPIDPNWKPEPKVMPSDNRGFPLGQPNKNPKV